MFPVHAIPGMSSEDFIGRVLWKLCGIYGQTSSFYSYNMCPKLNSASERRVPQHPLAE